LACALVHIALVHILKSEVQKVRNTLLWYTFSKVSALVALWYTFSKVSDLA
jgi:hypothetical protein